MPAEFPISSQRLTVSDPAGTEIPLSLTAPTTPGHYPLIVFSHGLGGSPDGVSALLETWARAGYVVVAPAHADSSERGGPAGGGGANSPAAWGQRVDDMSLMVDSVPFLQGMLAPGVILDASRPVAAGHSFGALTTMIATGTIAVDPQTEAPLSPFTDPRFAAAILLSPQGDTSAPFTADSWSAVTVPRIILSGTLDVGPAERSPTDRPDAYFLSPENQKFLAWFTGAQHSSFTGRNSDNGPLEAEIWAGVQATTTGFLDWFSGRASGNFDRTLSALEHASQGRFTAYGTRDDQDQGVDGLGALIGTPLGDLLVARPTGTVLAGRDGADTLIGGIGDDVLHGGAGDDALRGGDGFDTAFILGPRKAASITFAAGAFQVVSGDGVDSLINVERIEFDDKAVSLNSSTGEITELDLYAEGSPLALPAPSDWIV